MNPADLTDAALATWLEGYATLRPSPEVDSLLTECVRRLNSFPRRLAEALDAAHDFREAKTAAMISAAAHPKGRGTNTSRRSMSD